MRIYVKLSYFGFHLKYLLNFLVLAIEYWISFFRGLPTIVGSWITHYKSWKKFKKNYLLIKYEDLLENPEKEFFKITNYLSDVANYNFINKEIIKSIKNCEFKNLSDQEDVYNFDGNSETNKKLNQKFFHLGPKNKWQDILTSEVRNKIELLFENEMKEIGYLK